MSFYDEVMKAAEASSKQTNTSFSSSDFHVPEVRGLFGREAGVDYANFVIKDVRDFVLTESARKRKDPSFNPPVDGPHARERFEAELKALMPGFRIEMSRHNVKITWLPVE